MTTATLEPLESRRLLSAALAESEPNNSMKRADHLPRDVGQTIHVRGKVATTNDHDWFKIKLKSGDVLGVAVTGGEDLGPDLDPFARLLDAKGNLVIENSGPMFAAGDILPLDSPLPRADRDHYSVEFYRVIAESGTYYLDVSSYFQGSSGRYDMEVYVGRPGMESAPRGTKQILFLDFDGATVDWTKYYDEPLQALGVRQIKPLADALPDLFLTAADEAALVDRIVEIVQYKLNQHVGAEGRNDDFAIDIRNSQDHADPGDHPYVSRVTLGLADDPEMSDQTQGIAQWIDVGNYQTNDEAVVLAEYLTIGLQVFPLIDPSASRFEEVALAFADVICHEAGHLFGNFHSTGYDQLFGQTPDLMGSLVNTLGPDATYGTADDVDILFGAVPYFEGEFFTGVNDTLNTIAFGLTTGTRRGSQWGGRGHRVQSGPTGVARPLALPEPGVEEVVARTVRVIELA